MFLSLSQKIYLKYFELMALAEETSRQPSIDVVMWLLVATVIQISNVKLLVGQGKIQNVQSEKKSSTMKGDAGARSCAQGDKNSKSWCETK